MSAAKVNYLTTAQMFRLSQACHVVREGIGTPFLVGSVNDSPDYRDVDLRVILWDEEFDAIFGTRPKLWGLFCLSVSTYLSEVTGLPIDFQVQRMTEANENHDGQRNAMGLGAAEFAGGGDATRFAASGEEN